MPDDRYQRWTDASSAMRAIEPFMVPLVQGLGRFDCYLINEDTRFGTLNQERRRRRTRVLFSLTDSHCPIFGSLVRTSLSAGSTSVGAQVRQLCRTSSVAVLLR